MAGPDLRAIEAILWTDLEDPRAWAVYADALAESGEAARSAAIVAALRDGPTTPATLPPAPLDAATWYGHWRSLRAPAGAGVLLRRSLESPWARLVEHVALHDTDGFGWASLPDTVASATVTGPVGGDLGGLRALSAHKLDGAVRAPHLTHLTVDWLHLVDVPALPALTELVLRGPLDPDTFRALLGSPLVRRLRRLAVAGQGLAEIADALRPAWAHLERLTLDAFDARPTQGLVVRTLLEDASPDVWSGATWLRLAPPATPATLERAVDGALRALGVAGTWGWCDEPPRCGVVVPPEIAEPVAAWIARTHRCTVQLTGATSGTIRPDGVLRPDVAAWHHTLHPHSSAGAADVLDWGRIEEEAGVTVVDQPDEDLLNDDDSGPDEAYDDDDPGPYHGAFLEGVATPPAWPPDPFGFVTAPAVQPRRLTVGGQSVTWDDGFGAYLWWRAWRGRAVQAVPAPDLRRWTARLLARHRLAAEPDDPEHAFWADWRRATANERSQRSGEFLAAYKLEQPGPWQLDAVEARALSEALRASVPGHHPPALWAATIEAVRALLRGVRAEGPAELLVR